VPHILVEHSDPCTWKRFPETSRPLQSETSRPLQSEMSRPLLHIGRTMTESAVLSPEWVACCDRVDEVWVPTPFHVALFTEAGVAASKVM